MSKNALLKTATLILCSTFSAPLASQKLFKEPIESSAEIAKLHLNFLSMGHEINNVVCNLDSTRLFACVQGLHRALAGVDPQLALLPSTSLGSNKSKNEFLVQIGGVSIVRRPKLKFANAQRLQLWIKDEMQKSQNQWKAFSKNPFPAQKILMWIKKSLPKTITKEALSLLAFESIQETLRSGADPHQYLRPASLLREQRSSLGKTYAGIGIDIRTYKGLTRIAKVHRGSPSDKMNLVEGEELLAINKESLRKMTDDQIRDRLRDVVGSSVLLKLRYKNKVRELTLKRSEIVLPSVSAEVKRLDSKRYGYIKISDFEASNTGERVQAALKNFQRRGLHSVLLDLRNNGGGRMTEAIEVVAALIKNGLPILTIKTFGKTLDRFEHSETIYARGTPVSDASLIVLINANSGSAAEIVAGALEYHDRAVVIGERSFGKGTFQSATNRVFNGRMLKFKTQGVFYIADSNHSCQIHGILPHIEVPALPNGESTIGMTNREENLFNALKVESSPLVPVAGSLGQSLEKCMKSHRKEILGRYNEVNEKGLIADYQLIASEEALRCIL